MDTVATKTAAVTLQPSDPSILTFRNNIRGKVILKGDPAYDEERKVYNGMIDKRPAMIVKCCDAADVMTAVNFAREQNMMTSIRGGGHNAGGLGVCDDGLVIDLSHMNYTIVDPVGRKVVAGGGCTWGDVDHATHAFGLATPSGIISTTGVGGLTLGGGLGHLTRKLGLTIDNLLSADMVLADGSYVTVNENQHPDLFWAIRGGGGNFGVVTDFTFRLHPIDTVYGGPILYEMSETEEVLRWYEQLIKKAPDELNGFFAFLVVPPADPFPAHLHNKKMCGVVWAYCGAMQHAEEVFKPIRAFKEAALDMAGPLPQPALQSMFDGFYPKGYQWYWKADFVNDLSEETIAIHRKFGEMLPTELSTMHLYPVNGAASRISNTATAWNYRDATWSMVMVGVDPDPANREKITNWARQYWEALHPHSAGGAYVNFMMEEGDERIQATYGENFKRLAEIKKKYDPNNFFRVNQNIKPGK